MENCLELLSVTTLRHRLDTGGPLSLGEASALLDQVAEMLDRFHLTGQVHGAVNPGNVLLLPGNQVRLLSPNSARRTSLSSAGSGRVFAGDTLYLSPEEVRGEPTTVATDIWCLGSLLHEMLTGFPPFVALRVCTLRELVTGSEPEMLPQSVSAAQIVVDCALAKWPANRFMSAQDMANHLWAAAPTQHKPMAAFAAPARPVVSLQQAVNRPLLLSAAAVPSDRVKATSKSWTRFLGGRRRSSPSAAA